MIQIWWFAAGIYGLASDGSRLWEQFPYYFALVIVELIINFMVIVGMSVWLKRLRTYANHDLIVDNDWELNRQLTDLESENLQSRTNSVHANHPCLFGHVFDMFAVCLGVIYGIYCVVMYVFWIGSTKSDINQMGLDPWLFTYLVVWMSLGATIGAIIPIIIALFVGLGYLYMYVYDLCKNYRYHDQTDQNYTRA